MRGAGIGFAACTGSLLFAIGSLAADDTSTLKLADGVEMAYVARGAGSPALVFIHCGTCRKEIWSETLDAFAPTHRVVAMDLVGHGRSGAGREEITLGGLGADVAELVRHLELARVILVGNSLGGPTALEAARQLGSERVLGVIAVDTLQNVERDWPEDDFNRRLEALRKDFPGTCKPMMLSLLPENAPQAARDRIAADTCGSDPLAFASLFATLRTYDQAAALRAAGVPVRAINSDRYPTAVETNRKYTPTFAVALIEGVGHYPQVERPKEFQARLREFVDELAAPHAR